MSTRSVQKMIHVACRELGLDAETRRDIQLVATGKDSMSNMSEAELTRVLETLKAKGFKPSSGARPKRPAADRPDLRYIHVMWRLLSDKGALKVPGREGLNAFIRSRFEGKWGAVPLDVDLLRDGGQINDVTRALKDWCARAGVALK